MRRSVLVIAGLVAVCCRADELFPKPDWVDKPNPLASPDAVVGGELRVYAGQSPKSLNYYLDNNSFVADVFGAMYESLLNLDPLTIDYVPGLAQRWAISDDKKTFTFWLNPKARWSDGQAVTAEDVAWTFAALVDPKNLTGSHKVALEEFEPPVVVDAQQVRFTARKVHWRNLGAVGGFQVLPKHAFEAIDFNKINFEFPVVSGLYCIGEFKENRHLTLERRADWWNRDAPSSRNTGNFQTLRFCFFAEPENAFEAFKKGELDLFAVYKAEIWVKRTTGEKFEKNWIVRQKITNRKPIGFQGFAMNARRQPFADLAVRQALAHLLDRPKMNHALMYDQYFLHRSYYEDLYSPETPCPNEEIPFDKEKARALLAKAGWAVNPATGQLAKDGNVFQVKFLSHDATPDRFLAIFGEDLKDVGIELVTEKKDWSAWAKDMDAFNYDMTWAAWGAGLLKDPEHMWAASEADRPGGNNLTGFRDPAVDALIEKQRDVFDVQQRHAICREIDRLVARQCPYVLLWNLNYTRLLYWNRFGMPKQVLSKYGDETSAYWLWWRDEDSAADLQDAVQQGKGLPAKPSEVAFDQAFKAD